MKISFFLSTLLFIFVYSCQTTEKLASKNVEVKEINLSDFNAIKVSSGLDVKLYKSNQNRAKIKSKYLDYIKILVNDDKQLVISQEMPRGFFFNMKKDETTIEVWAKDVNRFEASSSGDLRIEGNFPASEQFIKASSSGDITYDVNCEKLTIKASASGDVEGEISVNNLFANASSSGDIALKGKAQYADLKASSSGDIEAEHLKAAYVTVDGSSSADIYIAVSKSIQGKMSSSSNLYFKADNPIDFDVRTSSSAAVERIK